MRTEGEHRKGSNAVEGVTKRLAQSPPNTLPDEISRQRVEAGWDGQWLNWDDLGGDDPGWGDIGD